MFVPFPRWTLITRKMVERKAFLANLRHQYHVTSCGEHDCSAYNRRNGDYYEYRSLSHFMGEHKLQWKWWKEKVFLRIQSINIMYPNSENIIVVPIIKRIDIIMDIHVCLISRMNFNYKKKMMERKASLANPKHQYHVS